MVVLPSDHRLAALKSIGPKDLEGETFVTVSKTAPVLRVVIDNYLKHSGISITPAHEADHLTMGRLPEITRFGQQERDSREKGAQFRLEPSLYFGCIVSSVLLVELSVRGDHCDKDILFVFGDVYQLYPAGHHTNWNLLNAVPHCQERLGSPRSAGPCHAVRNACPRVPSRRKARRP